MLVETIGVAVDWKCEIKPSVGICVTQSKYMVPPTSYLARFINAAWVEGGHGANMWMCGGGGGGGVDRLIMMCVEASTTWGGA